MRDQVSFQEDRLKQTQEELVKLKGQHIQKLEQEKADCEHDIERLSKLQKEFQNSIPQEIRQCEQLWERAKDKREKLRRELEEIKKRLEVVVDVRILNADLAEAEHLCKTIE